MPSLRGSCVYDTKRESDLNKPVLIRYADVINVKKRKSMFVCESVVSWYDCVAVDPTAVKFQ